jgi:hypothetical protein
MEALRALKRRLSDVVYRQLVADVRKASPGGHVGASTTSSAADPTATVGSSDQSQPGLDPEPRSLPPHDDVNAHPGDPPKPVDAARASEPASRPSTDRPDRPAAFGRPRRHSGAPNSDLTQRGAMSVHPIKRRTQIEPRTHAGI